MITHARRTVAKIMADFYPPEIQAARLILAMSVWLGMPQVTTAQSYGMASRPVVGGYFDGVMPTAEPSEPTNWSTANAFPNLIFQNPMGVIPIPGTNRLMVWEREGKVFLIDNAPEANAKTTSIDFTDRCQGWDDCGLLAMATHPDFIHNHYVFVFYTYVTPGLVVGSPTTRPPGQPALPAASDPRNRLSRVTLDANGIAIPGSEKVFIDQTVKNTWHKGGGMFFHPSSGLLYLALGNDVVNANNQVINLDLAAGVIRIDVDKIGGTFSHAPPRQPTNGITFTAGVPNYYIPNDNPFVGVSGALEEYYSLGLRSPHRMTIDPVSERIYIGDVGEATWEEIDIIKPGDPLGLNFQWPLKEGSNGDLTGTFIGTSRQPLLSFPHAGGTALPQLNSIIGGYVYRGSQLTKQLGGKYLFADNNSAKIYALDESSNPPTAVYLTTLPRSTSPNSGNMYDSISSFGIDANQEIYMTRLGAYDGAIYKLVASGGSGGTGSPLPAKLSQTGMFSSIANLTPSAKLIPYSINSPFWSDGAVKSRWAVIPDNTTVGYSPRAEWTFPAGSVFVKHFDFPVDETNPSVTKRLETRLLVKTNSGTYGATYKWREDLTDADLLPTSGLSENMAISTPYSLGQLTSLDIGNPGIAGSMTQNGDDLTIVGGGGDIWNNNDQFRFSHLQRSGDFDLRMRVNSLTNANAFSKVCLMARTSLDTNSQYVSAIAYPLGAVTRGYNMEWRTDTGGYAASFDLAAVAGYTFPRWLRLRREGNVFIAFTGTDGSRWTEISRTTIVMPSAVYVGVAVTAHDNGKTTTASVHLERQTRLQSWYYPSRSDCMICHNSQAGEVLGLNTRQLNKPQIFPTSGVNDNQIRAWNHVGLFSGTPAEIDTSALNQLAAVSDTSASLERRARSYFDTNCSYCHRPGGAAAEWDARYDTPLVDQGIINGTIHNDLGIPGSRLVTPQDIIHSVMHARINRTGESQMPPLARNVVDTDGVAMLTAWINSLPAISLTGATDGAAYLDADMLQLNATPTASVGTHVSRVEFWDNGVLIGSSLSAPFSLSLSGDQLSAGQHRITARVYDNQGGMSPSSLNSINVMPLELKFQGFSNEGAPTLQTQLPTGRTYTIEYTEDLTHWYPLQSNTANGQTFQIQDPDAGKQRFYRLVVQPGS